MINKLKIILHAKLLWHKKSKHFHMCSYCKMCVVTNHTTPFSFVFYLLHYYPHLLTSSISNNLQTL